MKKILFLGLTIISLSSCMGEGIERTKTNNDEFDVTYLFEKDGIKVYRFSDGMRDHYFTTGSQTISTHQSGKNNYYDETITNETE
jgi:hypothetical protein